MQIDNCSTAWTEAGPPYTYTCGGTQTVALASTPVIATNAALANMSAVTAGNTDHLRVKLTLPGNGGQHVPGTELRDRLHVHRRAESRRVAVTSGHVLRSTGKRKRTRTAAGAAVRVLLLAFFP